MTYSIVDRVTGEEVGAWRYGKWADAEEYASGLRITGEQPRAMVIEGVPEMPRRPRGEQRRNISCKSSEGVGVSPVTRARRPKQEQRR